MAGGRAYRPAGESIDMKQAIKALLAKAGWELRRRPAEVPVPAPVQPELPDLSDRERRIIDRVRPYTMTSPERIAAIIAAVTHLEQQRIPGAIVECGVWRGGSTMAAALTLLDLGQPSRDLHLFDTFSGMPPPTEADKSHDNHSAEVLLAQDQPGTGIWCYADLADVKRNLASTAYPEGRVHFVQGKVEDTLPAAAPDKIAMLRLDTDWYESTRHELEHLYPRLQPGGIMIVDDYGHWQGARKAVDEFLAALPQAPFLHRIDYTGRLLVKPAAGR